MPSRSLVHPGETQANYFKKPKDRVTLLGCANGAGTCKLPVTFVHKSARPRGHELSPCKLLFRVGLGWTLNCLQYGFMISLSHM